MQAVLNSRWRWVVLVPAVIGVAGVYRLVGPLVFTSLFGLAYVLGTVWYFNQVYTRQPARAFALISVFGVVSPALISIHFVERGGTVLIFLMWVFVACSLFAVGSEWCVTRRRSRWFPHRVAVLVVVASMILPFTVLSFWPLRAAFALSRPAMDRLADRIAHGAPVRSAEWAGLFLIWSSKTYDYSGDILLITGWDDFDEFGFLRVSRSLATDGECDMRLNHRWAYQYDPKD